MNNLLITCPHIITARWTKGLRSKDIMSGEKNDFVTSIWLDTGVRSGFFSSSIAGHLLGLLFIDRRRQIAKPNATLATTSGSAWNPTQFKNSSILMGRIIKISLTLKNQSINMLLPYTGTLQVWRNHSFILLFSTYIRTIVNSSLTNSYFKCIHLEWSNLYRSYAISRDISKLL